MPLILPSHECFQIEKESKADPTRHDDNYMYRCSWMGDEGERMELERDGETSEGQATTVFTGDALMCGHTQRGLSK